MTTGVSVEELLVRPVLLRGIRLGRPTDLVLDAVTLRAVGFEVRCGDHVDRFLPLPAARFPSGEIAVRSSFMLLDDDSSAFYRRGTRGFRSLVGAAVSREGEPIGVLRDLLLGPAGDVVAVRVAGDGGETEVPFDGSVGVGGGSALSLGA